MKLRYYHNLDGIRGIAALMVVVFHFFTYPNSNYLSNIGLFQRITEYGQHGVSLFFVLSGFVITRILINTRENKNYFRSFYAKRVLRILPLYYLFLFIYYFITPHLLNSVNEGIKLHLPFYFYIQNFTQVFNFEASGPGHYWSLAVEEHFYLLWPLVVYFINPKNLWKAIGITIILVFILKYFMLKSGISINYFTFTRIDQILMGAYLAVLEWNGFFTKNKYLKKMMIIGLSTFPLAVIIYALSGKFPFLKEMTKYSFLGLIFFSLLGILISLAGNHLINRFLSGSILQYLGRISYGIYVWHILALMFLNRFFISQILFLDLILTIGLTIILAHMSYYYFEIFFLKLKEQKISITNKVSNLSLTQRLE